MTFNPNKDIQIPEIQFNGFYRAVIKDNIDPQQNGAVQVKVYPMMAGANDSDLPWAIYADSGFGGSRDVGEIRVPEVGSHVFVFFENGDIRFPVMMAGAPAISGGIPDTPKLAREDDGTHSNIDANRKTGITTAGGGSFDEPASTYAAEYPKNKVFKTKGGHIIEFDDTAGAMRFHIYHPSGTRVEVDDIGNKTEKVAGKRTTIIIGDDNIKIEGTTNINVTGDCNLTAAKVKVESSDIELDSSNGVKSPAGVVTQNHIDSFTGSPYSQGSTTVKVGG